MNQETNLCSNSQLRNKIRCNIKERIRTCNLLLPVPKPLTYRMPFGITFRANDILIAIALEINHVAILLKLVELDINKDPDTV